MSPPELLPIAEISARLAAVFPEGTPNRQYLTRKMAARIVFTMLYVGAVERLGRWLGPKHVYLMGEEQAGRREEAERLAYGDNAWKPGFKSTAVRWFADNTREPIRDETLRDGLVRVGAAFQRPGVPTTSPSPRYALRDDFAKLFAPDLQNEALALALADWRIRHLDPLSLARLELLRQDAASATDRVEVVFPNRTIRRLSQGPSSLLSKAVVEIFAPRFLFKPAVLLLSESGDKIVAQEERMMASIGLRIDRAKLLPDIILFDLELDRELLVFVEVVSTDGPVSESRRDALLKIATGARLSPERIAFVSAYRDRGAPAFKKSFGALAWNTLAWFMAEPDHIVLLREKTSLAKSRIFDLIREGS